LQVFSTKNVSINGRDFVIHILKAKNGCFVIVSEGEEVRMGSIAFSTLVTKEAKSTTIIPSKFDENFSGIFAESISLVVKGLVLVSLYSSSIIDTIVAKFLLNEIKNLLSIEF
jgi:hypothetical protein